MPHDDIDTRLFLLEREKPDEGWLTRHPDARVAAQVGWPHRFASEGERPQATPLLSGLVERDCAVAGTRERRLEAVTLRRPLTPDDAREILQDILRRRTAKLRRSDAMRGYLDTRSRRRSCLLGYFGAAQGAHKPNICRDRCQPAAFQAAPARAVPKPARALPKSGRSQSPGQRAEAGAVSASPPGRVGDERGEITDTVLQALLACGAGRAVRAKAWQTTSSRRRGTLQLIAAARPTDGGALRRLGVLREPRLAVFGSEVVAVVKQAGRRAPEAARRAQSRRG